jgi:hypothetical protein
MAAVWFSALTAAHNATRPRVDKAKAPDRTKLYLMMFNAYSLKKQLSGGPFSGQPRSSIIHLLASFYKSHILDGSYRE